MPIQKKRGMLARGERLQIMLSPDELTAVDDFRFKHRMPSGNYSGLGWPASVW
jgi:hypothetical protein